MRFASSFSLASCILFKQAAGLTIPDALESRAITSPTWNFDGTGHYNLTLPNNRWALVHVNPNYDNSRSHPLVLSFHGAGANAQNQEAISNFSNNSLTINGMDFVMVYGQGTTGPRGDVVWQGAPYSSTANDISYVQSIVTAVKANLNIDSNRIYATGFSNGGGFVNLLACTSATSGLFAAYATSSAALYAGTRSMSGCDTGGRPIALVDFHGLNDGQIPYAGRKDSGGDTAYALPNTNTWRQEWAQRAGCTAVPSGSMAPSVVTTNYLGQNATSYRWDCPRATIIGYTVQTMAHFWLTKGGGYWDETPSNIVAFFNTRYLGKAT